MTANNTYEKAARARKVRALYGALADAGVGGTVAAAMDVSEQAGWAERAGVKVASPDTWAEVVALLPVDTGQGLLFPAGGKVRRPRAVLAPVVAAIDAQLAEVGLAHSWHWGGSWRRGRSHCGDLDLVIVTSRDLAELALPEWMRSMAHGMVRFTRHYPLEGGGTVQVDIWRALPREVGPFLCFITGPAELNIAQRAHALTKGLMLSQSGLFEGDASGRRIDDGTEEGVYRALGWPWLAPTERDDWRASQPGRRS